MVLAVVKVTILIFVGLLYLSVYFSGCGASVGYSCCGSGGIGYLCGCWHSGGGDGVGGDDGDRLC